MTADDGRTDDDVSRLLDAAIAAARRPAEGPAPSDEVAELLAKAQDLSRPTAHDEPDPDDVVAFLEEAKGRRDRAGSVGTRSAPKTAANSPRATRPEPTVAEGSRPKGLIAAIAIVAVAVLAFAAYAMGQSAAPPTPAEGVSAEASDAPVDPAQVAALMEKIAANPKDTDALVSLGNMYYGANDFANALTFYEKIAAIAPKDDDSWIPVAAAAFQGGKESRAFEAWNTALDINPDNIEAHYGLGHYYLNQTPTDEAKARASFEKVIALDPTSEQAKEVQTDLAKLTSGAATPNPAAS